MESILFQIIITLSVVIIYFINFILLFNNSIKQFGSIWEKTLNFALFSLILSLSYVLWLIRLFISPISSPLSHWIWFWKLKFILLLFSTIIIARFGLAFKHYKGINYLFVLSLIFPLLFIINIIDVSEVDPILVNSLSYISFKDVNFLLILIIILVVFYMVLPIYQFAVFVKDNPNKHSNSYKKAQIVMISLIMILISILINFSTFLNFDHFDLGIITLLADVLIIIAGILLYLSFTLYSRQISNQYD